MIPSKHLLHTTSCFAQLRNAALFPQPAISGNFSVTTQNQMKMVRKKNHPYQKSSNLITAVTCVSQLSQNQVSESLGQSAAVYISHLESFAFP